MEIFGPIAAATTFRTPDEAVSLASNTRYGLAASIWSENINVALGLAPRRQAWSGSNCTNMLDAGAGLAATAKVASVAKVRAKGLYEYLAAGWEKEPAGRRSPLEAFCAICIAER